MTNKEFPQQANMPYPYPMAYQDDDEIDLIELFRTLWKQKAKIALVTAVTTLAAGIYRIARKTSPFRARMNSATAKPF